jgi:single-strand DNA-binding protein
MPRRERAAEEPSTPVVPVNEVTMLGRLTAAPVQRELPSGDVICTFRVSVPRRGRTPLTARSKQAADWVDCVAGAARTRRTVLGWSVGDTVRVEGALRRRFYRAAGSTTTRLELEVVSARRLERSRDRPEQTGG